VLDETLMTLNEATVSDTVCVSNLHEDVTMLQLVEQFGMVGSVKVCTVELKWLYAVNGFCMLQILMNFVNRIN